MKIYRIIYQLVSTSVIIRISLIRLRKTRTYLNRCQVLSLLTDLFFLLNVLITNLTRLRPLKTLTFRCAVKTGTTVITQKRTKSLDLKCKIYLVISNNCIISLLIKHYNHVAVLLWYSSRKQT